MATSRMKFQRGVDALAVLVLVAISGNPAVGYFNVYIQMLVPFALFVSLGVARSIRFQKLDAWLILATLAVVAAHVTQFGVDVLMPDLAFLLRLVDAVLVVRSVADFRGTYVNVMAILGGLSLFFFVPTLFGVDMASLLSALEVPFVQLGVQKGVHIGLHYYRNEVGDLNRNCGMFWEPGAFAGYLLVACLLLVEIKPGQRLIRGIILAVALLTTRSTTGYMIFPLVLFAIVWRATSDNRAARRIAIRWLIGIAIAFSVGVAFVRLTFLQEKISSQLEYAESKGDLWEITRYGNALYDLSYIQERPFFGWSLDNGTRPGADEDVLMRQGNGLSGAAVRLGIPWVFGYFVACFLWFSRTSRSLMVGVLGSISVLLLLCGEQFLLYPLFIALAVRPAMRGSERESSSSVIGPRLTHTAVPLDAGRGAPL